MVKALDPEGRYEYVEASAVTGAGVFETLKLISKLTLKSLRRRMMGDEPAKATPPAKPMVAPAAPAPPQPAPPARPKAGTAVFTVHQPAAPPARPLETQRIAAVASAPDSSIAEIQSEVAAATAVVPEPETVQPQAPPAPPLQPEAAPMPPTTSTIEQPMPPPLAPEPPAREMAAEPEVQFDEAEKVEKPVVVEKEVKHVKVRNSIDVMAELDSLRKKATSSSANRKIDVLGQLDALSTKPKSGAVTKSATFSVDSSTRKSRLARVQITFEDDLGNVVQQSEQNIEIDKADWTSLQINLKIDPDKSS
jgi:hypothetical protein